ncbi:MAG: DUF2577 family protein [Hespellia sp.]|nr:DUF2577 family protein [Hespellia sp.]
MSSEVQEETSLKQMFQNMCPEGPSVIEGTVTSASPLQITLANDAKMILSANSLIVPRHLTNYTTTADVLKGKGGLSSQTSKGGGTHEHDEGTHDGHTSGDGSHTHEGGTHIHSLASFDLTGATLMVHNALKQGEIVYLLSFNNGKQYYVLDRKG